MKVYELVPRRRVQEHQVKEQRAEGGAKRRRPPQDDEQVILSELEQLDDDQDHDMEADELEPHPRDEVEVEDESLQHPNDLGERLSNAFRVVFTKSARRIVVVGTDTPLLSKASAKEIVAWMKHAHVCNAGCDHKHPVIISTAFEEAGFSPMNYWRGPVWINMNWMTARSAKAYGREEVAREITRKTALMIYNHGFREYYRPRTGKGVGAMNFTWPALVLPMIDEYGL